MVGIAGLPQSRSSHLPDRGNRTPCQPRCMFWCRQLIGLSGHRGTAHASGNSRGAIYSRGTRRSTAGAGSAQRVRDQSVFVHLAGGTHAAGSRGTETLFVLRLAAAQGHAAETASIATEVAPAQLEPPLETQPAAAAQSPTTLATTPAAQSIPATDPAAATIAAPVVRDAAVSGSSAAAESAAAEAAAVAALALVPDQG